MADSIPEFELDCLYLVALMRMRQQRQPAGAAAQEEMIQRAMAEMGINERDFTSYLESHREDLVRTMETLGI